MKVTSRVVILQWLTVTFFLGTNACFDGVDPPEDVRTRQFFDGDWDPDGEGLLVVQPELLTFDVTELGAPVGTHASFSNVGDYPLVIFEIGVSGAHSGDVRVEGAPVPLGLVPGETIDIELVYEPRGCDALDASMTIVWSDAEDPLKDVPIASTGLATEMVVTPDSIAFGMLQPNELVIREVEIHNLGLCPLHLNEIFIDGGNHFRLTELEDRVDPVMVTRDEPVRVGISFQSPTDEADDATLVIGAIEEDDPVEIPLSANEPVCPVAVALAERLSVSDELSNDVTAVPLDTVRLDASQSFDPDREVVSYHWQIIEQPEDSTTILEPNQWSAQPTLFLDLAGDYVVELTVYDDNGLASCYPDTVRVTAIPDEDIHVQLVWRTPGDTDETDQIGADVDLHLLRTPGGVWDEAPYDCHFRNMTPDWGVVGVEDDDPSLDIDDVNGLGPENINLDRPETGRRYAVGVYYYKDWDKGPSDVTVRIYLGGVLAYESTTTRLDETGVFWDIGRIDWPTTQVEVVDRIYPGGFPTIVQ